MNSNYSTFSLNAFILSKISQMAFSIIAVSHIHSFSFFSSKHKFKHMMTANDFTFGKSLMNKSVDYLVGGISPLFPDRFMY